jgi:hypothetical protein
MVLEACGRLWAKNRQHFFVSTKSPQLQAPPAPDAPAGFEKRSHGEWIATDALAE